MSVVYKTHDLKKEEMKREIVKRYEEHVCRRTLEDLYSLHRKGDFCENEIEEMIEDAISNILNFRNMLFDYSAYIPEEEQSSSESE